MRPFSWLPARTFRALSIRWVCLAALIAACAARQPRAVPEMWAEPRRCPVREAPDTDPAAVAVRCAEAFVARNGYTLAPPVWGSAQLAEESFESGTAWPAVLERRRGRLEGKASGVCADASDRPDMAYSVVFRYRDRRVTAVARVVTMDREFSQMRMQQADVLVTALSNPESGCQLLPPAGGEPSPSTH